MVDFLEHKIDRRIVAEDESASFLLVLDKAVSESLEVGELDRRGKTSSIEDLEGGEKLGEIELVVPLDLDPAVELGNAHFFSL